MAKLSKTFPKTLFVKRIEESGADYFSAEQEIKDIMDQGDEKVHVATYKLVEIGEVASEVSYKRKRFVKV